MDSKKLYESAEKMNCLATVPSLLKLTPTAFNDSETFHSNPYPKIGQLQSDQSHNKETYQLENGKLFQLVCCGLTDNNSCSRFKEFCNIYSLPHKSILADSCYEIKNYLSTMTENERNATFIMFVSLNSHRSVLPLTGPEEILKRFNRLTKNDNNKIVVAVPSTLSIKLFCGWANTIYQQLTKESFYNVINDMSGLIFCNITDNDMTRFNHRSSRVINPTTSEPYCVLVSTNPISNIVMNRIENYTGNGWNEYYGYPP